MVTYLVLLSVKLFYIILPYIRRIPKYQYPDQFLSMNGANFVYFPRKTKENGDVHSNYEIDCTQLECFLHQRIIDEHIK